MTALDVLRETILDERRHYAYIPDPEGFDAFSRLLNDEWDTAKEFEARGGGDCDGWVGHCVERGEEAEERLNQKPAAWYAVEGEVLWRGEWIGHHWVELVTRDGTYWADPTWGLAPADGAYPKERRPVKRWRYKGWGHFDEQEGYGT